MNVHCDQCGEDLQEDRDWSRRDYTVYEPCECGGGQCPHLDEDDCCEGRKLAVAKEQS
jgi:hypothetical protein